jgi:hypothetical protein
MEEAVDDVVRAPGWAAPIGWSTNPACRAVSLSVGYVAVYVTLDRLPRLSQLDPDLGNFADGLNGN